MWNKGNASDSQALITTKKEYCDKRNACIAGLDMVSEKKLKVMLLSRYEW